MTAPALPGAAPDPARLPEAVQRIRAYAVESAATCREAERARASDIANRAENHAILPMLREQHYSWGEKAKSYDALVAFIDALPASALGGDGEPVAWLVVCRDGVTPGIAYLSREAAEEHIGVGETIRPLYTRPAATGDTGEVERARAKVVDAAIALRMADAAYVALHTSVKDDDDALQEARGRLDHLHAARMNKRFDLDAYTTELLAATGGPDAR